jgi:hypothetical protein
VKQRRRLPHGATEHTFSCVGGVLTGNVESHELRLTNRIGNCDGGRTMTLDEYENLPPKEKARVELCQARAGNELVTFWRERPYGNCCKIQEIPKVNPNNN